jgi:hypothetical protein
MPLDADGQTLLHVAATLGQATLLVPASGFFGGRGGWFALRVRVVVVCVLLMLAVVASLGTDVEWTFSGCPELVELLLFLKCDPNALDMSYRSPLTLAVIHSVLLLFSAARPERAFGRWSGEAMQAPDIACAGLARSPGAGCRMTVR